MSRGKFITFEGGEGTGKSTQVALLGAALREVHVPVVLTREPGGSPGAEEIRDFLVNGDVNRWTPMTEALLNFAARVEHLEKTIFPALNQKKWVISDRFFDSTLAYQGFGHGVDSSTLSSLKRILIGDFKPDLTFIFDLDIDTGLARARSRGEGEDRYESMGRDFHERLRKGFLEIAQGDTDRCCVIDASLPIDQVALAIRKLVSEHFEVILP